MSAALFACISFFAVTLIHIPAVNAHGVTHPIGKLIKGTFASYDKSTGDELSRLYVCKHKANYYFSVIQTIPSDGCCANFMIGNGRFTKSGIDYHDNVVSAEECFFQKGGVAKAVSSCELDAVDLCDEKELSLSFMFGDEAISLHFVKISTKDEILGNDQLYPYQCGIPYDGDLSEDDTYPLAFVSPPSYWIGENGDGQEVQTFLGDFDGSEGCWTYIEQDGTFTGTNGPQINELHSWQKKHILVAWNPRDEATTTTTADPDPGCTIGSQITIRVDRETLLISWQCADDTEGAAYLSQKTDAELYGQCPVFPETTQDGLMAMAGMKPPSSRVNLHVHERV